MPLAMRGAKLGAEDPPELDAMCVGATASDREERLRRELACDHLEPARAAFASAAGDEPPPPATSRAAPRCTRRPPRKVGSNGLSGSMREAR
jgi:hypothetical protein